MHLINKTSDYLAFKVKTTDPKKYGVRPNAGIVLPRSTCNVTVTMQVQTEAPPDMQCKDKFLVQSVIAPHGTAAKDITAEMFNKEEGKVVEEFKLPSYLHTCKSSFKFSNQIALVDAAWSMISKLTEEKTSASQ